MSSSSRIDARDVGGSAYSQDAQTPGSGSGGTGNATSIQGTPVAPGGAEDDVLALQGGVWTPTPVNAVELQGFSIDPIAPLIGQALVWDGSEYTPTTPAGGGDVSGPGLGNSTDNAVVRWDGTTGTSVQDSLWSIDDSGNLFLRANARILPQAVYSGELGSAALPWGAVYSRVVVTGDLCLHHPEKPNAQWRLEEFDDHLELRHEITGRKYRLVMKEKTCSSSRTPIKRLLALLMTVVLTIGSVLASRRLQRG